MKISLNWLQDFIKTTKTADELSVLLTNVGLEVEGLEKVESIKGGLEGLVVGFVTERIQHPNADRLSITKVDVGQAELLQIVCGASNVAVGQKVIVALVGTTVHPLNGESFKISKSKIRGEVSEGMICAEDEIGLGNSHDGILVLPNEVAIGTLAKDYFKITSDRIFEIGLTPNRADAASHLGVARDIAAITDSKILFDVPIRLKLSGDTKIKVSVEAVDSCKRYSGIYLQNVRVQDSPEWLKTRLASIGVKSINNVVDVSNYVCHGLGQPMHAFDADKIVGDKIIVKNANAKEKIQTLDTIERELSETDMVVCNAEHPMCIAGVMGGLLSGVSSSTKNIFLESAYFDSVSVRKASKAHAIKSDSSFRFERGTDPNITLVALQFACNLLKEIAAAEINYAAVDYYPLEIKPATVNLSYSNTNRLIGKEIPKDIIRKILIGLEIEILEEDEKGLSLSIPTAKVDVTRECDVIEEILRIYGLNQIEMPAQLRSSLSFSNQPDEDKIIEIISEFLSANGYHEMMSNSLTTSNYTELLNSNDTVKILNPLSNELNALRNTLYFSGLEAISYNQNRKETDLKLYEFGSSYHQTEKGFREVQHLTIFLTGNQFAENWHAKANKSSFFSLKAKFDQVLNRVGLETSNSVSFADEVLENGFISQINNKDVAKIGGVRKTILKKFDINNDVWVADINLDELLGVVKSRKLRYQAIPKFPLVKRDLSMLIPTAIQFGQLKKIAMQTEKNLLKEVSVFDVYEGDKLPEGKKSYALSFILQDEEKTLTDVQIDGVMNKLIKQFESEVGAEIRKA